VSAITLLRLPLGVMTTSSLGGGIWLVEIVGGFCEMSMLPRYGDIMCCCGWYCCCGGA